MNGMVVKLALTADMANVDGGGKLNILGVFGSVNCDKFPYVLQTMAFVALLSFPKPEWEFERTIVVKLMDQDGNEIHKTPDLKIGKIEGHEGMTAEVPLICVAPNLKFNAPGTYQWSVIVNGIEQATSAMIVKKKPA